MRPAWSRNTVDGAVTDAPCWIHRWQIENVGVRKMGFLEELKHDLVDPIKTFTGEVYDDSIGDAKRFYSAQAKNVQRNIRRAKTRTKEKAAAIKREQEEMKKHRKAMMKRATIIIAVLSAIGLVFFTIALRQCM